MDLYREDVMDHYEHPRNQGEIEGEGVISDSASNSSCGDRVEFFIKTNEGKIVDVKWRGIGCAITTASASKLSEWLVGQSIQGLKDLSEESIVKAGVGIEVSAGRMKCLTLPVKVVKKLV